MRIIKHRIYGDFSNSKMSFSFEPSGECRIIWKAIYDDNFKTIKAEKELKGVFDIKKNKLILKYGNNQELRWMAEITYLYHDGLEVLDLNGDNVGEVEYYRKESHYFFAINTLHRKSNEKRWYHMFIGVPKHRVLKDIVLPLIIYGVILYVIVHIIWIIFSVVSDIIMWAFRLVFG